MVDKNILKVNKGYMMKQKFNIINIIIILFVLVGDIFYITYDNLWIKSITSLCFVLLGGVNLIYLVKTNISNKKFPIIILIGLTFACGGDILLEINFITGAILFAIGHIFYFASYCQLIKFKPHDLIIGVIIFVPSVLFIYLAPIFDFGGGLMKIVCILYAIVISCMVGKAITNLIKQKNVLNILLVIGSALFFFSDLMLLLNVFADLNSIVGALCLATYYPAQCILAHSILYVQKASCN